MLGLSLAMKKLLVFVLLFSGKVMAGYNLHIERELKISESEWLEVCKADSELNIQHSYSAKNPETGEVIEMDIPNSCLWTAPESNNSFYLVFSNGSITLSYHEDVVEKAKNIAHQLNAKVVGDEGEEY